MRLVAALSASFLVAVPLEAWSAAQQAKGGREKPPASPAGEADVPLEPLVTPAAPPESPVAKAPAPAAPPAAPAADASASMSTQSSAPPRFLLVPKVGTAFSQVLSPLGTSFAGALEVGYLTPLLGHQLGAMLELAYSQPQHQRTIEDPRVPGGSATYTLTEKAFGIFLGPKYYLFPLSQQIVPYGALGLRMQMLASETIGGAGSSDFGQQTETGTHLAFAGQAGAAYRLGPGHAALELQFLSSPIQHLVTGDANIGHLAIRAGYLLHF